MYGLFWALLMVSAISAYEVPSALQLERVALRDGVSHFFVGDVDADGVDELGELSSDYYSFIVREFSREAVIGPALYQTNLANRITQFIAEDIDPDIPGDEVILGLSDDATGQLWLEVRHGLNKEQTLMQTVAVQGEDISDRGPVGTPPYDGAYNRLYVADLDGDGDRELIATLDVGFDLYPRAVQVFDYPSGELLWSFRCAGNPQELRFIDADGDGTTEIFFKTFASFNGAIYKDRMDTAAYIFALDHTGHELWRDIPGDRFDNGTGNVEVCDCDGDGTVEIYYTKLARSDDFDQMIRVLEKHRASDGRYLQQRSFDPDLSFVHMWLHDIDDDDITELILDHDLSIIDPRNLETRVFAEYGAFRLVGVTTINTALWARKAIIATNRDSIILVDTKLNMIAAVQNKIGGNFGGVSSIVDPFGNHYIIGSVDFVRSGGHIQHLYIYRVNQRDPMSLIEAHLQSLRLFWPTVLLAFFLGIPMGIVVGRLLRDRSQVRKQDTSRHEHVLEAISVFDHGNMAGKNLNRLAFLFENFPDSEEKITEIRPNIENAIDVLYSYTSPQLTDVIRRAEVIPSLRTLAGTIALEQNNLANLLRECRADSALPEHVAECRENIPRIVGKLKATIKRMKGDIQQRFSTSPLKAIAHVLSVCAPDMDKQQVVCDDLRVSGNMRHPVFISESSLESILEELFANAMAAMETSGGKCLRVEVAFDNSEAEIRVIDTGTGLVDIDPAELFSPEYSSKGASRGLGLYHIKRQVERFGGRIKVMNNADGPGATAIVVLKLLKES